MGLKGTYRDIIIERVQNRAGFSLEQAGIPARQWNRLTALSELLHETIILEQMIKVEKMQSRSFSSRISSRIKPSRASDLDLSVAALESVKQDIWARCDDLAHDIIREKDSPAAGSAVVQGSSEALRCRSCGGGLTILAYNNFKCGKCGLGYSARDFLELLRKDISEV